MSSLESAIFGRYVAGESPVHHLDPRAKLLITTAYIVIVLIARTFWALGICALFLASVIAVSRIPVRMVARSAAPLLFIVVITVVLNLLFVQGGDVLFSWWIITVSQAGAHAALFFGCRLVLLLTGACLLTLSTPTLDITEAFERLLAPLARIGVPAHELGMLMGIALRFLPQFAFELTTVYRAQISRGATFSGSVGKRGVAALGSLIVPLFASAFRHAETLAAAMDARCYHGAQGRTRLNPLVFARRDGIACALTTALLIAVVATDFVVG